MRGISRVEVGDDIASLSSTSVVVDFVVLICSLPGAIGMYGLSVGISKVSDTLPRPAYALLSGLNAGTVGIIALAAVQLSQKAISDKVTRIVVFLGATAGLLYNALWYFPLLMFLGGCLTIVWDFRWLQRPAGKVLRAVEKRRMRKGSSVSNEIEMTPPDPPGGGDASTSGKETDARVRPDNPSSASSTFPMANSEMTGSQSNKMQSVLPTTESAARTTHINPDERDQERVIPAGRELNISWQFGAVIIAGFFVSFIIIMVLRGTLKNRPLLFSLFSNLYLAGTIIFGGGPVVIPLLRESVRTSPFSFHSPFQNKLMGGM